VRVIRRDWRFYNSCMLNLDMQPVHSYISSPTGPDTLNLTIVVHLGQRPSTLRVFLAGRASVLLLLLPITPAKRQHRFINQVSIPQAPHIHIIIIIIIILSDPGIVVCISIYLPDLCFGGRQTDTHAYRDRYLSISIEFYPSCFKPLTGTTRRDLRARYTKTNPSTAAGIAQ
jgi:hypothetical protein